VLVRAGELVTADGDDEGAASVDESAVTGESAPVIREGGDRSAVTGGTRALRLARDPRDRGARRGFLDRMISWSRARAPAHAERIALDPAGRATIVFSWSRSRCALLGLRRRASGRGEVVAITALVALFVLLAHDHRRPALGHRHRGHGPPDPRQRDRLSGRAVEATATWTCRWTRPARSRSATGKRWSSCPPAAAWRSWPTRRSSPRWRTTPEGRSIVVLAKEKYGLRGRRARARRCPSAPPHA
jgi:K+-transporting ATPase ATPase B chain